MKLGLSQPAVSMIVADLEKIFAVDCLIDGEKIILNNRGKELLPLARRMLAEAPQEIESIFNPDDTRGFCGWAPALPGDVPDTAYHRAF